jgi:hypothetical protein
VSEQDLAKIGAEYGTPTMAAKLFEEADRIISI